MVKLDNLFLLINERGSAKKVSDDTGISSGNISDWKNGRSMPTAIKLDLLADYFNVSVDYLLGRTDNPKGITGDSVTFGDIKGNQNTTIGKQDNNMQSNNVDCGLLEVENIISKLSGASRYRAIADILDVLEKYA